jgi:hypothetical protein
VLTGAALGALVVLPLCAGCSENKEQSGGIERVSTEEAARRGMEDLKGPHKPLYPGAGGAGARSAPTPMPTAGDGAPTMQGPGAGAPANPGIPPGSEVPSNLRR